MKAENKNDKGKKNEKSTAASAPAADNASALHKTKIFLKSERTHFITGLVIVMISVFLFVSFLSFFFTGDSDQSKLAHLPFSQLTDVKGELKNWAGSLGAYCAEVMINRWIGISAFMISVFLWCMGTKFMKVKDYNLLKVFLYTNIIMIWGPLFFGFFFVSGYEDSFIYLGGAHGYYTTLLLKANIGWFGTFLLIIVSFICILILVNKKTIEYLNRGIIYFIACIKKPFKRKPKPAVSVSEQQLRKENSEHIESNPLSEVIQPQSVMQTQPSVEEPSYVEDNLFTDEYSNEEQVIEKPSEDITFELIDNVEIPNSKLDAYQEPEENTYKENTEIEFISEKEENEDAQTSFKIQQAPEEEIVEEIEIEEGEEEVEFNIADSKPLELIDESQPFDPRLELSRYRTPSFDLLEKYDGKDVHIDMDEQNANKQRIEETLRNYGIEIQSINATIGPTITLYEIVPKPGVRISKIRSLEDDIALSLAALGIRIIAPIPGKGTVGIEVPNKDPQMVSMYSIIASRKFQESKYELPVALGKTITNEIFMFDLAKMPHVLVAGATGQGKSVGLNAIITSLLYRKHPSELKMVLIDPKKVEFNIYSKIEKHFLAKLPDEEEAIITDVTKVVATLNSICKEMDERYDLLKAAGTRNIIEYNERFKQRRLNPEKGHRFLPYMVVIVDEFGDLIMTAGKEVELPIARIAQLARAVGIHMIIATQRPSTNIITGIIKANFPARVAFRVTSMIDSRTILDNPGANQLIGRGDLLFSQGGNTTRVQCAFVDTPEVEKIAENIGEQQGYPTAFYLPEYVPEGGSESSIADVDLSKRDPMFKEVALMVVMSQSASTSMIQRKFSIGFNRAGRIMDQLEAAGIVGGLEGGKTRQINVMDEMHLENVLENMGIN